MTDTRPDRRATDPAEHDRDRRSAAVRAAPPPRRAHLRGLASIALLAAGGPALAQSSAPPLRVILPVGAGSGVDVIFRTAQPALARALGGRAVVVENLPGAGGVTGTQAIVRAAPDGNTIGVISNNHAVNPSVYRKLPYDSLADVTAISVIGSTPFVLVVNPEKVPARNAKELQAFLKAKPGAYNYASSGNGTIIHLAGAMFAEAAQVDVKHVPYRAVGPMLTDVMSGQVEFCVTSVPSVQGTIRSGQLRPIGITGRARVASLPDVPTMAEQGFPDVDASGWFAAIGPAGMPAPLVAKMHDAIVAAWADPETKAAMARQDNQIAPTSPDEAARFLRSEQERYGKLVRRIGLQLD